MSEKKYKKIKNKVHYNKLVSTFNSKSIHNEDKCNIEKCIIKYNEWIKKLQEVEEDNIENIIKSMVELLHTYKFYVDVDLIFKSNHDYLYSNGGQTKISCTIIEEFLPILVRKCIYFKYGKCDFNISSQTSTTSSMYFRKNMNDKKINTDIEIKKKAQDFSITRALYIRTSYSKNFEKNSFDEIVVNIPYLVAECKTNLDKTMFQEAVATAKDLKVSGSGAKYILLCDFLDMPPVNTSMTDIEEVIILRKANRINQETRDLFKTKEGRNKKLDFYKDYLEKNPYDYKMFLRFIEHVFDAINDERIVRDVAIERGFF